VHSQVLVAFVVSFVVTRLSEMILFSDKPHYTLLHAAAHVGIGGACLLAVLLTLYAPITLVHSHVHLPSSSEMT
jgi:hypothetical protein